MLRVLVGGFGDIAVRGIRAILRHPEFQVEECGADAVTDALAARRPDALLLETGPRADTVFAEAVAAALPGLTVVACSAHRTDMRVRPRESGAWHSRRLSAQALLDSVRS